MLLEYKDLTGAVQDVDAKGRKVTGYLSSFGNKDHDGDIIQKGAFSKSISERKDQIFFLNQHDWSKPLSRFSVLQEDAKGLYFESNPLPDTSYASDVMKLYEAGVLKEHSIGFVTIKDDYNTEEKVRYIKEVKLYEGSVVTLGANSQTPFTGFKSLTIDQINEKSGAIMKMLRNGTLTDDTFLQLEIALKQLQREAYELGKKSLEAVEDTSEPIDEVKQIQQFITERWN